MLDLPADFNAGAKVQEWRANWNLMERKKIEEKLQNIEKKEIELLDLARAKAKKEREEIVDIALKEKEKIVEEARQSANREVEKGMEKLQIAQKEAVKSMWIKYIYCVNTTSSRCALNRFVSRRRL